MHHSEEDIYATPNSDPDTGSVAQKILSEQSMLGVIVGSLSAGIPSTLIYALIVGVHTYPFLAYILPGILIGYTARFCGRAIELRFRLMTGAITLVLLLVINYVLTYPSGLLLSLPSVAIAIILSKRKLTRDENTALARWLALGR
ncbi:MAG: hypothetical protein MJK04_26560 [Psychrosphaera sp.]|nr:hypothetical protein [Psychrosphaera sp.]